MAKKIELGGLDVFLAELSDPDFKAWATGLCADLTDERLNMLRLAAQAAQSALPENAHWPAVRALVDTNDELEVDDDAVVSEGDDGAFVQAWVWVPLAVDGTDDQDRESYSDDQDRDSYAVTNEEPR